MKKGSDNPLLYISCLFLFVYRFSFSSIVQCFYKFNQNLNQCVLYFSLCRCSYRSHRLSYSSCICYTKGKPTDCLTDRLTDRPTKPKQTNSRCVYLEPAILESLPNTSKNKTSLKQHSNEESVM